MKLVVVLAVVAALGADGCLTGEGGPLPRTSDREYRAMAEAACTSFVRSPLAAYTGRGVSAELDRLAWLAQRVGRAAPREPAPTSRWRRELTDPVERMERTIRRAIDRVHAGSERAGRHVPRAYADFRRRYLDSARRLGLGRCLRENARLDEQDAAFRARAARICRQRGPRTLGRLDGLAAPARLRRLWRETLRDVRATSRDRVRRGFGDPQRGLRMLGLGACAGLA